MPEVLGKKITTPRMIAAGVTALALGAGLAVVGGGGENTPPESRAAVTAPTADTARSTTTRVGELTTTTLVADSSVVQPIDASTSVPVDSTAPETIPVTSLPPAVLGGGGNNQGGEVTRSPEELPVLTRERIETSLQPYVDKYTTNPNSTTFDREGRVNTNFNLAYSDGEIQGFWSANLQVDPTTHKLVKFTVGAYGGNMEAGDGVEPGTVATVTLTDTGFSLGYEIAGQPVDLADPARQNTAFADMQAMTDASLLGTAFSRVPLQTRAN